MFTSISLIGWIPCQLTRCDLLLFSQEGSENEEEEREEDEEENTDYLTDSNKENETDEENNVRRSYKELCMRDIQW